MALDPNIILQGRGIQIDNPIETQNKLAQLYQARSQNRLADLAFTDNQRERAGENSLSQLLADGKSGDDVVRGLASQGYGSRGLAYGKQFLERQKATADIGKVGADTDHTKAQTAETQAKAINLASQQHRDALNTINDPQQAAVWVSSLYSDPRLAPITSYGGTLEQALAKIPSDPAEFQQWKMQSQLGAEQWIKQTTPDANARLTAKTARDNNSASLAVTMRGQNMTDARMRETLQQGKTPAGYRANPDGTLAPIPGGPADPARDTGKPATEFEGKSAIFGARAEQADKILSSVKYSPAAVNVKRSLGDTPLVGGMLGAAMNSKGMSPEDQQAEQAQRDFVNAVLRQESGAAITASEFDNATKQYFPQPGDSQKAIEQKAANRKLTVDGLKRNAGRYAYSAPPAATSVLDAADAILKGGK